MLCGSGGAQAQRSEVRLGFSLQLLLLLLLPAEDDADDVPLVLLHVLHQALLAGGLEPADAAAEKQHAILGAASRGAGGSCLWLSATVEQRRLLMLLLLLLLLWGAAGLSGGLVRLHHGQRSCSWNCGPVQRGRSCRGSVRQRIHQQRQPLWASDGREG